MGCLNKYFKIFFSKRGWGCFLKHHKKIYKILGFFKPIFIKKYKTTYYNRLLK